MLYFYLYNPQNAKTLHGFDDFNITLTLGRKVPDPFASPEQRQG